MCRTCVENVSENVSSDSSYLRKEDKYLALSLISVIVVIAGIVIIDDMLCIEICSFVS